MLVTPENADTDQPDVQLARTTRQIPVSEVDILQQHTEGGATELEHEATIAGEMGPEFALVLVAG